MKSYAERAPSTARGAGKLARRYGYLSLKALIDDIPTGATVIDFGAGYSNLGLSVAKERDDVTWLNIDPEYARMGTGRKQPKILPNLRYIAGSVLNVTELELEPVDRIFSSALLPHLVLDGPEIAEDAVHNMASLLKPDGTLHVLPLDADDPVHLTAAEYALDPQATAGMVVDAMTPPLDVAKKQRWINSFCYFSGYNSFVRLVSGVGETPPGRVGPYS